MLKRTSMTMPRALFRLYRELEEPIPLLRAAEYHGCWRQATDAEGVRNSTASAKIVQS
jgi:hypothetical protein